MFGWSQVKKLFIVEFNNQIDHSSTKQFYKDMEFVRNKKSTAQGVVIRINCPGGSPSLSYEISEYIKMFKKDLPVYIYIESMATSGGYFIAAAGDIIYSNPYAVVGSIGVILQKIEISGLADKIGVQEDNVSVGNFKQPVSLFKPIDFESEDYLKNQLMNPIYNLFVENISKNRNIPIDIVKSDYADGKIFIASESVGKLVDELITFHQLTENLGGEMEFVNTKKKTLKEKLGLTFTLQIPQLQNSTELKLI